MSGDGVTKFIMLVGAHFPRQKFAGEEEREALWLRSMGEILGVYADDVLMEAAGVIIRTRDPKEDSSMFPKPVECIRACENILRKRLAMAYLADRKMDAAKSSEMRALPSIEIKPGEPEWTQWLDYLRSIERHDLVGEAESNGKIKASTRWPREDSIIYEPKPSSNTGFLNSLLSYKTIPN